MNSSPSEEFGELRLEIPREARAYHLGGEETLDELWVVLHGYGQLARYFLRHFREVATPHRRILAPEGLSRFYLDESYKRIGASWMTRDDRDAEIHATNNWLNAALEAQRPGSNTRITILGFSQGAPVAGRWWAQNQVPASRMIFWGAGGPRDLPANALEGIDLSLVLGREDPFLNAEAIESERERLDDGGVNYRVLEYSGGHHLDCDLLQQFAKDD